MAEFQDSASRERKIEGVVLLVLAVSVAAAVVVAVLALIVARVVVAVVAVVVFPSACLCRSVVASLL